MLHSASKQGVHSIKHREHRSTLETLCRSLLSYSVCLDSTAMFGVEAADRRCTGATAQATAANMTR